MVKLGDLYSSGDRSIKKDEAKAGEWYANAAESFRKNAEKGDADAQLEIGLMYTSGSGVPRDFEKAEEWLRKAAKQGNARAMKRLGQLYSSGGERIKKDEAQAGEWYTKAFASYRKAADKGNAEAESEVGLSYLSGRGVTKDAKRGEEWLMKPAKRGYSDAMLALGVLMIGVSFWPRFRSSRARYCRGAR